MKPAISNLSLDNHDYPSPKSPIVQTASTSPIRSPLSKSQNQRLSSRNIITSSQSLIPELQEISDSD